MVRSMSFLSGGSAGDQRGADGGGRRTDRPRTVLLAAVFTWISCVLGALQFGYWAGDLIFRRSKAVERIQESIISAGETPDFSAGEVANTYTVLMSVAFVWCLVAIWFSWLSFQGSPRGRVALICSSIAAAAVSVLLGSPISAVACAAVIALLFTPSARAWFLMPAAEGEAAGAQAADEASTTADGSGPRTAEE